MNEVQEIERIVIELKKAYDLMGVNTRYNRRINQAREIVKAEMLSLDKLRTQIKEGSLLRQ